MTFARNAQTERRAPRDQAPIGRMMLTSTPPLLCAKKEHSARTSTPARSPSKPRERHWLFGVLLASKTSDGARGMLPKWQPISTAPKDGTEILIFAEDEETTGNVLVSRWRNDTIPNGWAGSERPSHWLPLPLPPKVAKGAANGEVAAAMEG